MSYIHCHNCDWEQDDFWGWRYNPVSCFLRDVAYYLKPRRIQFDSNVAGEMGWTRTDLHSWYMIVLSERKMFRRIFRQKWWTYRDWKRAKDRNICPSCKGEGLCVD